MGGYGKFGKGAILSIKLKMTPHFRLKIIVKFAVIDSWDNEKLIIKIDNVVIYERQFHYKN